MEQEKSLLQQYYENVIVDGGGSGDANDETNYTAWEELDQWTRDYLERSMGFAAFKFALVMQEFTKIAIEVQKIATKADEVINSFQPPPK